LARDVIGSSGGDFHLDIPVDAPGEKGFYRILIRR
jgi:hypothetical protein